MHRNQQIALAQAIAFVAFGCSSEADRQMVGAIGDESGEPSETRQAGMGSGFAGQGSDGAPSSSEPDPSLDAGDPVPAADADAPDAAIDPATDVAIRVTDNVIDEGLTCFKIETPSATYFYDKKGAGFSSIVDREGNDWVGFHPTGDFNGNFRGIPNLGPCCHAGNPDKHAGPAMESRIVDQKAEQVVVNSATPDGNFDVTWVFRASAATLTVTKIGGQKYWFLYEGTPGGMLEESDYWVSAAGVRHSVLVQVNADLPSPEWLYFGDGKLKRVLFFAHHEDDAIEDQHYAGAVGSMTVFGFGRTAATPLMSSVRQHFTIGLVESTVHETIRSVVEAAIAR